MVKLREHIIKRIYDNTIDLEGKMFFVDLLWPRGLKKASMESVIWKKSIVPSTDQRKRCCFSYFIFGMLRVQHTIFKYMVKLKK
ncbi:DUF488 family protein, N3 subclade [Lacrimispora amygdalina]|uniref:DUF488 family protein, N3 subclade n=1 Tax=Lacrimispora amygdalina TaxID=253257 RepID=UPI0026C6826A